MNILITGGSSGLGGAITRTLAKDISCKIYFTYSRVVDSAVNIEKEFSNTTAVKCDFRNPEEVENLKSKIAGIDIDVLINNAYVGEAVKSHFHKTPPDDFFEGFRDSILPTIILTQAAINSFRKKRSGKIITILRSFLVNAAPNGTAVYVANKAYLEKLTKVWATENAKFNITSNSISPSFMLTNLTKETDERIIDQMVNEHPLKRILTTGEVAEAVKFLVHATSHINGIDVVINAASNIK